MSFHNAYSICIIDGELDSKTGAVVIKETKRIKTNLGKEFSNCLQIHFLKITKRGGESSLEGSWKAAPGQNDCGNGVTQLSRVPASNSILPVSIVRLQKEKAITESMQGAAAIRNSPASSPSVKNKKPASAEPPVTVAGAFVYTPNSQVDRPQLSDEFFYEQRIPVINKIFQVHGDNIRIELLDNGVIDGDSIAVSYNGKIIGDRLKLSEKPLVFTLPLKPGNNDFTMHAVNLGSIPPNTAVMSVIDEQRRYEVSLSSDMNRSATIRFSKK